MAGFDNDKSLTIPLVGDSNEVELEIGGVSTVGLLDTGSMVTTIAKDFYDSHLQSSHPLKELDTLLTVKGAGGNSVPFYGFIEVVLSFKDAGLGDSDILVPVLVIQDTDYNKRIPMLIGTNVIGRNLDEVQRLYGDKYMQQTQVKDAWRLA